MGSARNPATSRSAINENPNVTSEENTFAVGKISMDTLVFCNISLCATSVVREDEVELRIMPKIMLPERIYMG